MSEDTVNKDFFIEQMQDFEKATSVEIMEVLDKKDYILETEVLGLISMAKALALTFAPSDDVKDALLDTSIQILLKK